jgi:menaquinone-dependent protoporphyrinogen oxidase
VNILIGYATVHGTTAEVARVMGEVFSAHDFSVQVVNVEDITHVDEFDAFVIGSAIHTAAFYPRWRRLSGVSKTI